MNLVASSILVASGLLPTEFVGTLLLIAGLIVLSACYSGTEAVLFSLSASQLQHAATSPHRLRRLVGWAMQRPKRTLMEILLGNTAVNVLLYSTSYTLVTRLAPAESSWALPVSAAASVLLNVACGEVLPKVVGVGLADRLAPLAALVVRVTSYPAALVRWPIETLLVEPIMRVLFPASRRRPAGPHAISADELKALLELSRRRGLLHPTEDMMLREVVNLAELRVRDVLVPRVEMLAYDLDDPPETLRALMRRSRLKKVPVYDGSIDRVLGWIYAKVLFFNPGRPLRELLTPARFIPEHITCEQALSHFRHTRSQIAIAVDEFGGVAGLVTLEDVLEAIVGEIHAPGEDVAQQDLVRLAAGDYDISGGLAIHDWAEAFGLPRFTERVATVGGLITARLGRAPRVGDRVTIANVELTVTEVRRRRVERLRLRLLPPAETAA